MEPLDDDDSLFWSEDEPEQGNDSDYEPGICPHCNGSGEGQNEGSRCNYCKGKGEI